MKFTSNYDAPFTLASAGYRNEAHFRALYHRLESCGTITARRGGLACFGESSGGVTDVGSDNWVAVRYESVLCAKKALCQDGNFVSLGGGSTMIIGVMPLSESDAAARLGIDVAGGPSRGGVTLSGDPRGKRRRYELQSEEDVILYQDERRVGVAAADGEARSGLDSLCGKVLAWFFMWDTQA